MSFSASDLNPANARINAGATVNQYTNTDPLGQQKKNTQVDSFTSSLREANGRETKQSFLRGLPRMAAISLQTVENIHKNPP